MMRPAVQLGEVGGMSLEGTGHQEPGRGRVRVVTEQLDHDVQQNTLAVLPLAVQERHDLRTDVPGDRVAQQFVEEADHLTALGVVAEGVGEETLPARCPHRPCLDARDTGVVVLFRIRGGHQTGVEVDHSPGVHNA